MVEIWAAEEFCFIFFALIGGFLHLEPGLHSLHLLHCPQTPFRRNLFTAIPDAGERDYPPNIESSHSGTRRHLLDRLYLARIFSDLFSPSSSFSPWKSFPTWAQRRGHRHVGEKVNILLFYDFKCWTAIARAAPAFFRCRAIFRDRLPYALTSPKLGRIPSCSNFMDHQIRAGPVASSASRWIAEARESVCNRSVLLIISP